MAALRGEYDDYNRSWPKVFVGEYAARDANHSLRSAIAEAAFLLGLERNADVVEASAFAPLLAHVRGTQWDYNLVNFNASAIYVLPSYHAQAMLRASLGGHTLEISATGAPAALTAAASIAVGALSVKLVNYGGARVDARVELGGWRESVRHVSAAVLTADSPDAQNTLDAPDVVAPAPMAADWVPGDVAVTLALPAWSLVVVSLAVDDSAAAAPSAVRGGRAAGAALY